MNKKVVHCLVSLYFSRVFSSNSENSGEVGVEGRADKRGDAVGDRGEVSLLRGDDRRKNQRRRALPGERGDDSVLLLLSVSVSLAASLAGESGGDNGCVADMERSGSDKRRLSQSRGDPLEELLLRRRGDAVGERGDNESGRSKAGR